MRNFLLSALAIGLMLFASACGSEPGGAAKYQIAVIPKSVSFDFWNTVQAGARAAATELDSVEIIWKGTSRETNIAGQVRIVESFITQGVDAIVIAAADSRGLVPVLKEAKRKGIALVTIDSGTEPQLSASHIATDNVAAAGKAADLMARLLGEEGQVALIPYIAGASTSNQRERGFKQGLKEYQGLELVATQYSGSDYAQAMSVTEDILTAHPSLDAIFAANEPSVLGAAQALKARDMTDDVVLVGFDAAPREIEGVRSGVIEGLIVQRPFQMGYKGVMMAYQVLQGETVPKQVNTGSTVVTQENLDAFLEKRKRQMATTREASTAKSDSVGAAPAPSHDTLTTQ